MLNLCWCRNNNRSYLVFAGLISLVVSCNTNQDKSSTTGQPKDSTKVLVIAGDSAASAKRESSLPPEKYKSHEYDSIGFELMNKESLGELHLGLDASSVKKLLGEPEKTSERLQSQVDAQMHQTWTYIKQGIILDMTDNGVAAKAVIGSIDIKSPCNFISERRIGIGSTLQQVQDAYKKAIDKTSCTGNEIVAGSVYGGIIFTMQDGKVSAIFIGAEVDD